jgi:hypothetical protein
VIKRHHAAPRPPGRRGFVRDQLIRSVGRPNIVCLWWLAAARGREGCIMVHGLELFAAAAGRRRAAGGRRPFLPHTLSLSFLSLYMIH